MTVLDSGMRYPSQTVPVWAVNDYALGVEGSTEQPPKMWAVRMNIPAGLSATHMMLAVVPKAGAAGFLQAGLYEEAGPEYLPIGTTIPREAYSVIGWQHSQFVTPIPARDTAWTAWLVFNHGAVNAGFEVVRPVLRDDRINAADCYTTDALDALPASYVPGVSPWQVEHRIPLVGLTEFESWAYPR